MQNAPGDTLFPSFSRKNFPDSAYDPSQPIYVGKIIDTAFIEMKLMSELNNTDTIGLQANTVNGILDKEYTGLSGSAGTSIIIDTIYNMLLTQFDCRQQKFTNTLRAGRKWATGWGYNFISSQGIPSPYLLSDMDEVKVAMTFYFGK